LGRYDYEAFHNIKYSQAATASKIFNRVIRHKCYDMLYKYKNNKEYFSERMNKECSKMAL